MGIVIPPARIYSRIPPANLYICREPGDKWVFIDATMSEVVKRFHHLFLCRLQRRNPLRQIAHRQEQIPDRIDHTQSLAGRVVDISVLAIAI